VLKVVLDTNVFVSSLLVKSGLPTQILEVWHERRFLLIVAPSIIAEIRAVLSLPRIRRKYHITDEDVQQLVTLLERDALVVPGDSDVSGAIPDDPADEMVLACAVAAGADLIISGDRHLLDLGPYRSIPILTARQFLERLERPE
jgi:putative PIN family toxin of toxin-antitoxin system